MAEKGQCTLVEHLKAVKAGKRTFENAFKGVSRMILERIYGKPDPGKIV